MSTTGSVAADTVTSGLTTEAGQSVARSPRGGRGRGRGGARTHTRTSQGAGNRTNVFKGTDPGINGCVFQRYHEQTDRCQYGKTLVEALEGYVKKGLKCPEDLATLFSAQME